jgi:lipopolysaccharide export system protein LptA
MIRSDRPTRTIAALLVALACSQAGAEKADRYQPINVEANRMQFDDLNQVNVFTGNVILTRGTLMIRGDRMVLRQDPEGFQSGTVIGKPATFRQKRDALEQWIEGQAEELAYDGRNETVRLTRGAQMRRTEGQRVVDQIEGGVIVYDSRTEQFVAEGAPSPDATGRVRVTIQPRIAEPAPGPGAPAGVPL